MSVSEKIVSIPGICYFYQHFDVHKTVFTDVVEDLYADSIYL